MIGTSLKLAGKTVTQISTGQNFTIISSTRDMTRGTLMNPGVNHTLNNGTVVTDDDADYDLVQIGGPVVVIQQEVKITITQQEVQIAVVQAMSNSSHTQFIGQTRYSVKVGIGGVGLYHTTTDEVLSNIKWGQDGTLVMIDEMNTRKGYEGNGFGKLVVLALLACTIADGCTKIRLGTTNTAPHFWGPLGIQSGPNPINVVWGNLLNCRVTQTPVAKQFEETKRDRSTGF
jgi:hypothetical protein